MTKTTYEHSHVTMEICRANQGEKENILKCCSLSYTASEDTESQIVLTDTNAQVLHLLVKMQYW